MAISDVYDALISRRVYKEPMTHEQACEQVIKGKGTQFDPLIIEAFISTSNEFREIALRHADGDDCAKGE
jgi:putative two-component system response regulator